MIHPTYDLPKNLRDGLVPSPQVARVQRHANDALALGPRPQAPELGCEAAVKMQERNYCRRGQLKKFRLG
jgi:hypothetical protein